VQLGIYKIYFKACGNVLSIIIGVAYVITYAAQSKLALRILPVYTRVNICVLFSSSLFTQLVPTCGFLIGVMSTRMTRMLQRTTLVSSRINYRYFALKWSFGVVHADYYFFCLFVDRNCPASLRIVLFLLGKYLGVYSALGIVNSIGFALTSLLTTLAAQRASRCAHLDTSSVSHTLQLSSRCSMCPIFWHFD
jgi:hypothetical protein